MRGTLPLLCLLVMTSGSLAATVTTIDDFNYPDAAALQAAWEPTVGTPPAEFMAHGNEQTLRIGCPFATVPGLERGSFDRKVNLDLSGARSVTFDLYCDDPTAVGSGTIYFQSGDDWYHTWFVPTKGWQHVVRDKSTFFSGDRPGGWDKVSAIRISFWPAKSAKAADTFCAIGNLQARTEDVAVIIGSHEGAKGSGATGWAETIIDGLLTKAEVRHDVMGEAEVESGLLSNHKLAIFPFSSELSDKALGQIRSYVDGGGKIIFFFATQQPVMDLLGVVKRTYSERQNADDFADVVFTPNTLPGLPSSMAMNASSTNGFEAGATHNARVIGNWRDRKGRDQGPAVLVSDNGAFMGYFLTGAEPAAAKKAFLLALVGHFVPEAWETAATDAFASARQVRPFTTPADFDTFVATAQQDPGYGSKVRAALAQATVAEGVVRQLLAEKRYPEAHAAALKFHEALGEPYFAAHKPRPAEFRGVWIDVDVNEWGTWDEAMQRLQAAGFNAVVPIMSTSDRAAYDSRLLPHSKTFEERGDQLAQCVAVGKKHGIEVHVLKINWSIEWAAKELLDRMRAEHRLQANAKGEETPWLCPSDPRNFDLERDAVLEVVRNYDVDGIQFDYIRYHNADNCYCDGCRQRFEALRGAEVANWPTDCHSGALKAAYGQFRCDQITRLVKTVSVEARRLKPWIKISAAVLMNNYPSCRDEMGQDWVLWCKQGYLDFVCPMDYSDNDEKFQAMVADQVGLVGGALPLYAGIGAFINPDEAVVGQVETARSLGADGFVLYALGKDLAVNGLPKYAKGITSKPTVMPHAGPHVHFEDAPGGAVKVTVVGPGQHRQAVKNFSGHLELQNMAGRKLADLGELPATGKGVAVKVTANAGGVRVAAVGVMVFADASRVAFVVRSKPYAVGTQPPPP